MERCKECGFPCDPWGSCIRCVSKEDQAPEQRHCEKVKLIAMRELGVKSARTVTDELSRRFPELSITVVEKLEKKVRRRKRKHQPA